MFGIWVFTSQGAHGSLVLKSGSSCSGGGPLWAWPGLLLQACLPTAHTCSEAPPHCPPPHPGLLSCRVLPMGAKAGCALDSIISASLPHLRRQAGELAFTEPFLCLELWAGA